MININLFTRESIVNLSNKILGSNRINDFVSDEQSVHPKKSDLHIFLSHSHYDAELVKNIIVLLANTGISVYIDWLDDSMPVHTCAETAIKIKNNISNCQKFVLLATDNALASRWCNWEVGIGDTLKKKSDDIAIFAVKENNKNWSGNEYLQLYPCIVPGEFSNSLYIRYPNGKTLTLKEWLTKNVH